MAGWPCPGCPTLASLASLATLATLAALAALPWLPWPEGVGTDGQTNERLRPLLDLLPKNYVYSNSQSLFTQSDFNNDVDALMAQLEDLEQQLSNYSPGDESLKKAGTVRREERQKQKDKLNHLSHRLRQLPKRWNEYR